MLCDSRPGCQAVNYSQKDKFCSLTNTNKIDQIDKSSKWTVFDLYLKNTTCLATADSSTDHLTTVRKSILYQELETRFEVENDFGEKITNYGSVGNLKTVDLYKPKE